jgi:hypothetical protein
VGTLADKWVEQGATVLHYAGDRTQFDPNHLIGPDFGGGFLKPVDAEYDSDTDQTTIVFQFLLHDKWPREAHMLSWQQKWEREKYLTTLILAGHRPSIEKMMAGAGVKVVAHNDSRSQQRRGMGKRQGRTGSDKQSAVKPARTRKKRKGGR